MIANGILLIDKPQSFTSHDVVAKLRGILRERGIGHSGTLDPMATGLLVVFAGRATRAVSFAEGDDKEYVCSLRLGLTTDTQDITGTALRSVQHEVSAAELESVLGEFRGLIMQTPPMYSAVKVGGERLYKLARRGETVERLPREIEIKALEYLGMDGGDYRLRIVCSKGTYIRALCHDIGGRLGCGGTMSALRRHGAGGFRVEDAYTLDAVQEAANAHRAGELLIPADRLFERYPSVTIGGTDMKKCLNGASFAYDGGAGTYRVYGHDGEFLMLGRVSNGTMSTIKSFFEVGHG